MPPGVLLDSLSEREATLTEWQSQLQRREEIIRAAEISKEAYAASSSRTAAAQQHCHRTHTLLRPHRYEHVQSAAAELASRDAVLSQREAAVTVAEGRLLESESTRKAAHEAREAGITIRLGDVVQREKVSGSTAAAAQQLHTPSAAATDCLSSPFPAHPFRRSPSSRRLRSCQRLSSHGNGRTAF